MYSNFSKLLAHNNFVIAFHSIMEMKPRATAVRQSVQTKAIDKLLPFIVPDTSDGLTNQCATPQTPKTRGIGKMTASPLVLIP